jgi:hypothetical protein
MGASSPKSRRNTRIGLQLALLNVASSLETLMIVFDNPTCSVPIDPLPRLFDGLDWHGGEFDPFERLNSISRHFFPHTHDPGFDGLPSDRGSPLGRLDADRLPRNGKRGGSGRSIG